MMVNWTSYLRHINLLCIHVPGHTDVIIGVVVVAAVVLLIAGVIVLIYVGHVIRKRNQRRGNERGNNPYCRLSLETIDAFCLHVYVATGSDGS